MSIFQFNLTILTWILTCLIVVSPVFSQNENSPLQPTTLLTLQDLAPYFQKVEAFQNANDWDSALSLCEELYESKSLTQDALVAIRKKFADIRPNVKPNTVVKQANTWRVKAFIIKNLDYSWQAADGTVLSCKTSFTDDEVARIQKGMLGFAEKVWKYTNGWLRIDWTCELVDSTLTELSNIGDLRWAGPIETLKALPDISYGSTDTIMTFIKSWEKNSGNRSNDRIPFFSFGAAIGVWEPYTKGATYITFHWEHDSAITEPDGEPMLHEWLHSLQWALEERRGWRPELPGNPDGGRFIAEERDLENADPCYRRNPDKENSWIAFYEHILQTHVTRKMLLDVSLHDVKLEESKH